MIEKINGSPTPSLTDTSPADKTRGNTAFNSALPTRTTPPGDSLFRSPSKNAGQHSLSSFRQSVFGSSASPAMERQVEAFNRLGFAGAQPSKQTSVPLKSGAGASLASGSGSAPVANVSAENRIAQQGATATPNQNFRAHLASQNLEVVPNSGKGNNCSIYALVHHADPTLGPDAVHREVGQIRKQFDTAHPDETHNMLLLDTQAGGHGQELVSLVNQRFKVNMHVGVVQAGVEEEHPVTQLGLLQGNQPGADRPPTHRVVVWDQHGHFEAVRGKAPLNPAVTASQPAKPSVSFASTLDRLSSLGSKRVSKGPVSNRPAARDKNEYQLAPLSFGSGKENWFDKIPGIDPVEAASPLKKPEVDERRVSRPPSSLHESVHTESAKAPAKVPDPQFSVPTGQRIGQAFDRSKPGFTTVEANGIRPFGNLFNAAAATEMSHGAAETDLAITGVSVGGVHETIGGAMNGHALLASTKKRKRYGAQLDTMLAADVKRFHAEARTTNNKPKLDTLMLTRDSKGRFVYDMNKVAKLAASDKPEHAEASAHAKNVFLTAYIKDEVAGKREGRAAYEVSKNVLGLSSAALLVGATHGLAAAPASASALATKKAGLALGFTNALDVGKGLRGLKQRMRDDKQREINNNFLTRRLNLKPGDIPSDIPEEHRQDAIGGVHEAMKESAKVDAGKTRFRAIFKGSSIDETKSTSAKSGRSELAATHALNVIEYHVDQFAANDPRTLQNFHRAVNPRGATLRQKDKLLTASVKTDPNLRTAYTLMRDVGMRRSEATAAIHSVITRKLEMSLATDSDSPVGAATADAIKKAATDDGKPSESDIKTMKGVLQRR